MPRKQELAHRRTLPPATELAARVRGGMSLRDLAAELGIEPQGLAQRLISAGYATTGETEKEFRRRELKEHLRSTLLRYHEPWIEQASCGSVGGDFWFPEVGEPTWQDARRICQACPVLMDCMDWVMRTELGLGSSSRFGITAGMSPAQRHKFEPVWLAKSEGAA